MSEPSDIELIRLAIVAHREQIDFQPAMQRIEQRIVDLRAEIDSLRHPILTKIWPWLRGRSSRPGPECIVRPCDYCRSVGHMNECGC